MSWETRRNFDRYVWLLYLRTKTLLASLSLNTKVLSSFKLLTWTYLIQHNAQVGKQSVDQIRLKAVTVMFRLLVILFLAQLLSSFIDAISIQPRIINGVVSNPTDFSFFVNLRDRSSSCGGSLLNEKYVFWPYILPWIGAHGWLWLSFFWISSKMDSHGGTLFALKRNIGDITWNWFKWSIWENGQSKCSGKVYLSHVPHGKSCRCLWSRWGRRDSGEIWENLSMIFSFQIFEI